VFDDCPAGAETVGAATLGASTFGIAGGATAGICGFAGGGGSDGLGMPSCGIPGICPPGGAPAGGAAGVGALRFVGTEISLVYSLGPCGEGTGVTPGEARNAWVAPPPCPYEPGGVVDAAAGAGGAAPAGDPGPNMRVYSPSSWGCGGRVGTGPVCGNWDAEGNCGPAGIAPGDGLKSCENSPPVGF